jgi:CelD/BcsL family acetyltransferase involved in cellulose biosynthesis
MLEHAKREQPDTDAMSICVVATSAALDALGPLWQRLHEACSDTSVFQSFEWQRTWWQHFGEPNQRFRLHVVVLEQNGLIIAIAPFFIQTLKTFGVIELRQLTLLGRGISDYTDLLVLPGFEDAACAAIGEHLTTAGVCDVMSFVDVPDRSLIRTRLAERLARAGWLAQSRIREQCPQTQLMDSWPRTLESFGDSHRKRVAYLDRKLRKNFRVEVRRVAAGEDPAPALDEFISMHQRRWTRSGEPGAFAADVTRRFHHDAARKLHGRGWLVLTFLMLDDRPVVANYSFKSGGRLQFYLSGIGEDEAVRRFAPGILLHVYGMQAMIEEGVHTYDFLRGTERYKYELGAHDVPSWGFTFVRDSFAVRLKHGLQHARNSLGASAKRTLAKARARKAAA